MYKMNHLFLKYNPHPGPFTSLGCICILVGSNHFLADLFQPQHSFGIPCHLIN